MASSHIIRLGTIKGKSGVLDALRHNKRTLQAERGAAANIDANKTSLNYAIFGDKKPEDIVLHTKFQMLKAGIEKPRKNGVMGVEVLFSLPIDRHSQDTSLFFKDCYDWVIKTFPCELLSFDVHLDESAPHAHAILLPLVEGRMQGNRLIGGRGNLKRLIKLFHSDVAQHYGLSKNLKERFNMADKLKLERLVLAQLKNDCGMQSSIWPCIRDAIHTDPLPFAQMLSINFDGRYIKATKSFVDHRRSKGKGTFYT